MLMSASDSRMGSAAPHLVVGGTSGANSHVSFTNYDMGSSGMGAFTAGEITGVRQTDGVLAYQQLRASGDPYDPKFNKYLLSGTVTVGILTPVKTNDPAIRKVQPPMDGTPPDHLPSMP